MTDFRSLHRPGHPLLLANAWDVVSACLVERAGAAAIATTSAGVAWSLGAPDGNRLDRDRALDLIARVSAAVSVPVTADIEGGFADSPAGVAAMAKDVVGAGAVGVNIEDGAGAHLLDPALFAERVAAARDGGGAGLFINARTDAFLRGIGEPAGRLRETLDRAAAYVAAGADGIFVPGTSDPDTIRALVTGIDVPVNIMVGPGSPSVSALAALGVGRISLGSSVAAAAYAVVRSAAVEMFTSGTYSSIGGALPYADLNGLLA